MTVTVPRTNGLAAREKLETQGVKVRVVSLPCWTLFDAQPLKYREAVLPPGVSVLAIEVGVSLGWRPYVGPGINVGQTLEIQGIIHQGYETTQKALAALGLSLGGDYS